MKRKILAMLLIGALLLPLGASADTPSVSLDITGGALSVVSPTAFTCDPKTFGFGVQWSRCWGSGGPEVGYEGAFILSDFSGLGAGAHLVVAGTTDLTSNGDTIPIEQVSLRIWDNGTTIEWLEGPDDVNMPTSAAGFEIWQPLTALGITPVSAALLEGNGKYAADIEFKIDIPASTPPGTYAGGVITVNYLSGE